MRAKPFLGAVVQPSKRVVDHIRQRTVFFWIPLNACADNHWFHKGEIRLMKSVQKGVALLIAAAMAAGVTACGTDDASEADTGSGGMVTLRVGIVPIVTVAPLLLGDDQGFFEEEGIKIEVENATSSATIVPAIMSGDLDIGYGNITSTILARSQGLPISTIAVADGSNLDPSMDTNGVLVKADGPVKEASDLEGRKVAINALQASNYVTVRASVDELGADSSAYEFVEIPFPDMVAALEADNVAGAAATEPFITQAVQTGDYRVLFNNHNIAGTRPGNVTDTWFSSEPVISEKREAVEGFVRAMAKANEYATAHPEEARAKIAEYTGIDPELIPNMTLPSWPSDGVPQEDIQLMLDLMIEYGLLEEAPAYSGVVYEWE
jgi:NitT/TauT family transport system substrate-binding protein